jgi:transcriptional regulator with XRE-family HTH domain
LEAWRSVPPVRSPEHFALGAAIRAERQRLGLTQEALGDRADLQARYLGGVERGEINVALENLLRIVNALDTTLEELARRAQV